MRGKMEWKKPSKELSNLLADAVEPFACQKKMMFGAPVYTVNGNMFTGVHEDHVFLRLADTDRKALISKYSEVKPFEPLKGRIMKEYVVLSEAVYLDQKLLREWVERSLDYASSLPSKKAGSPSRRHKGVK